MMLFLNAEEIRALAPPPRLIDTLRQRFGHGCHAAERQVLSVSGGTERLFLIMPAFDFEGGSAVKLATVFPDNAARGLPTIQAAIVVFSNAGTPVALLDGTTVTQLRTGAASALASQFLSRADSSHLVIVGTGALIPSLVAAHCVVRPITRISVWGRRAERAADTVTALRRLVGDNVDVHSIGSLEQAVATAGIVSCATSSTTPLLAGRWLRAGTHVDLVGSFSRQKREADDDVVRRSRIFVDTFQGALTEAGDVLDPLSRGVIERRQIEGELSDLVRGKVQGRARDDEITVFKSVGTALEDLAAAQLIVAAALAGGPLRASS